jgi:hypothetical protein
MDRMDRKVLLHFRFGIQQLKGNRSQSSIRNRKTLAIFLSLDECDAEDHLRLEGAVFKK